MDCLFQYCQFVERRRDHLAHEGLVIGVDILGDTLRDDRADGRGAVSHQGCQAGQRRALHLEIGDAAAVVVERFDFRVELRVTSLKCSKSVLSASMK